MDLSQNGLSYLVRRECISKISHLPELVLHHWQKLTVAARLHTIHPQPRVLLLDLPGFDLRQRLDRAQAGVFRQRHRDRIQSVGKRTHRVLFETGALDRSFLHRQRARNLRRSPSIHHPVIFDEISDDAEGVMQRSFRFVDDHLVASTDEHGDRSRVGALFDDEHLLARGAEAHFPDDAGFAQLACCEIFESRHDAPVRRDGDQLDLRAPDPSYCRELVLQQQMVGFVVEPPLTYHQVGSGGFDLLDHFDEFVLLVGLQPSKLFDGGDIELVFGLGFRRLKGASEDCEFGISDLAWHLRVGEIFVNHHTFDKQRVFQRASYFAVNLD